MIWSLGGGGRWVSFVTFVFCLPTVGVLRRAVLVCFEVSFSNFPFSSILWVSNGKTELGWLCPIHQRVIQHTIAEFIWDVRNEKFSVLFETSLIYNMLLQQAWVQFVYLDLGDEEIVLGDMNPNIPAFILQLHFNTRVCQAWICPHFCFFTVKLHLHRETTRNFQNNILNQIAVTAHKDIFPVHKKALRVCYCDFGSISTSSAGQCPARVGIESSRSESEKIISFTFSEKWKVK